MSDFKLIVNSAVDAGDEHLEANIVKFDVVEGTPSEDEVSDFLMERSTSVCNISYSTEEKAGYFVDLNFEYKAGQMVSSSDSGHNEL